jgi:hypothetical protein
MVEVDGLKEGDIWSARAMAMAMARQQVGFVIRAMGYERDLSGWDHKALLPFRRMLRLY